MANQKLSEKQVAAIEYLAVPKRGGLTYEQIAEEVGIARSTLQEWRKDEGFNRALTKRTIQLTQEHLPDVLQAAVDGITEEKNAAMLRTFLQMHGLLTEKHEVSSNDSTSDIDGMKAELEAFKNRRKSSDK